MQPLLLIIGHTIPEPNTTGAGVRMMQILSIFQSAGYNIQFASTATQSPQSENLDVLGIETHTIKLNDPSFNLLLKKLNPQIVIFDRFITEEQFGWRVSEVCSDALKILDTEDLHFLRDARRQAVINQKSVNDSNFYTNLTKRELASIMRCDMSLIISAFEYQLLTKTFNIPEGLLFYLPFILENKLVKGQFKPFEQRSNFIHVGNFKHAPNVDSVEQLIQLWPKIRKRLPEAELHIYGDYASSPIKEQHNENIGLFVRGWIEDLPTALESAKVNLAPLRFGAGLKGKIFEAIKSGTPTVTTSIGLEGFCDAPNFPGIVQNDMEKFVDASVTLYTDRKIWNELQLKGIKLLNKEFHISNFEQPIFQRFTFLMGNLESHRKAHFLGQVIQHHSILSTKYMSKWIEAKNKK